MNDLTELAANWLIRVESHSSPEAWDELQQWLDADVRHRAAFIRIRQAWIRCDRLKHLRPADGTIDPDLLFNVEPWQAQARDGDDADGVDVNGRAERGQALAGSTLARHLGASRAPWRSLTRRQWLAAAAGLGTLGVTGWLLTLQDGGTEYETSIGGREQVTLLDGTGLQLNTNSKVRVRMSAARRDVELVRGEALFTVAHDPQRPFYVAAKGTLVRAVGTEFSVRIRDDQRIEVLVAEGRVLVGPPIVRASRSEPVLPVSTTALGATQRAILGPGTLELEHLEPDVVVRRLAWRTGRIAFDGDALQEAVREFNRYNKRRLVIADPAIRDVRIGGMFDATDPESFVAALESSFGIHEATGSGGPDSNAVIRLVGRDVRTPRGP